MGRGYDNWRPRGSGDWLLIVTCGGAGRVRAGGVARRLEAGEALLYAPGAAQDYATDEAAGRWHLRWAHFRPRAHWRPWLLWPRLAPGVGRVRLTGTTEAAVQAALERMLTASRLGGAGAAELAMNALEEALLWIFRLEAGGPFAGVDERVRRAASYLAATVDEPFALAKVAAHCGLSESRLGHLFRAELGTSPQRFSEQLRLDTARSLLTTTNLPVGEVARETGFADALYFSRRFRKQLGCAPSEVRRGG